MTQNIQDYIQMIDPKFKDAYIKLLDRIQRSIPDDFELIMQYGMPSFVVPLTRFPQGYHCDPNLPLPFLSLGVTKHHIGVYHMGLYADESLYSWFQEQYKHQVKTKLDMGKSCIRLKNPDTIPYTLIADLASKISVQQWIETYTQTTGTSHT